MQQSPHGQTLEAQLEQLCGAGCTKIYREKVTRAHSDRRELLRMLAAAGDVVTWVKYGMTVSLAAEVYGAGVDNIKRILRQA
ncbi:MAG: hypothetical protein WA417_11920 [Stellaceae bacterium]